MNGLQAVAVGVALGIITSLGLIVVYPPSDAYLLQNPYWDGMSTLRHDFSLTGISNLLYLSQLVPSASHDALLIIGPSLPYTKEEAAAISGFVRAGGLVVVADDFGTGNQLLALMNMSSRFNGNLLIDPLYNIKAGPLPLITQVNIPGVHTLAFNYATYLNVTDPDSTILAWSSPFSFADLYHTGSYIQGDPLGPFPVVASIHVGRGRVILISDSSLYINSMITEADNYASFASIVGGRQPFIDTSHWVYSGTTQAKQLLVYAYDLVSTLDLKYALVLAAGLLVAIIKVGTSSASASPENDAQKLSRLHPDWNLSELQRLAKERSSISSASNGAATSE
jgi:hypothetical protein